MSLTNLLTHRATVRRLTAGVGVQKSYQDVSAAVPCLIQPLDAEAQAANVVGFSNAYKGFMLPSQDVRLNDHILSGSLTFKVRGIQRRNYGPTALQHLELLLENDAKA